MNLQYSGSCCCCCQFKKVAKLLHQPLLHSHQHNLQLSQNPHQNVQQARGWVLPQAAIKSKGEGNRCRFLPQAACSWHHLFPVFWVYTKPKLVEIQVGASPDILLLPFIQPTATNFLPYSYQINQLVGKQFFPALSVTFNLIWP